MLTGSIVGGMPAHPASNDTALEVLGSIRSVVRLLVRDRLILILAFLASLGAWAVSLGVQDLSAAFLAPRGLRYPLRGGQELWIFWLFAAMEGISLLFYYSGRRRLGLLDREFDEWATHPASFRDEFRFVAGLDGRFAEVRRTREHNVGFGIVATMLVLWTGFPLLQGEVLVSAHWLGVWWIVPFVGVVMLVWLGLSVLHRRTVSRLLEGIESFTERWTPPAPAMAVRSGPGEGDPSFPREPVPQGGATLAEVSEPQDRDARMLLRARDALLACSALIAVGAVGLALGSAVYFFFRPEDGGWYYYLFLIEGVGVAPALFLAWSRWSDAQRTIRSTGFGGTAAGEEATQPLTAKILEVRRTVSVLATVRRLVETSLVVSLYGAAWLSIGVLFVSYSPGLSEAALILLALAIAGYLPVWFHRIHAIFTDETEVRSRVERLRDVEFEFWSRF